VRKMRATETGEVEQAFVIGNAGVVIRQP
jgi:hypothetical protein